MRSETRVITAACLSAKHSKKRRFRLILPASLWQRGMLPHFKVNS